MTSGDEMISGLISETEQSHKESNNQGKRYLQAVGDSRRLKKKIKTSNEFMTEETDEFMDEGTMSKDLEESEDFHTESSIARPKKKKLKRRLKRDTAHAYLDMEASSGNEDDTMPDGSEDAEITKAQQEKLFNDAFENQKSYKNDYYENFMRQDPETLARRFEESEEIDLDGDYEDPENTKFTMLPSLKDPKLFRVRCRIGSEKEAAICLMNKYLIEKGTKNEISIFSASALDKFTGCIFVEAHRDFHVKEAIKGMKVLNMNSVEIIPVKEITQIFTPDPSKNINLEVGQFVRVKRGLYDGDLAIIQDFDEGLKKIKVKIVPRLMSGTTFDSELVQGGDKENRFDHFARMREMKRKNMRPAPRFFNPEEFDDVKVFDGPQRGNHAYGYKGKKFENGLLLLTCGIANLQTENVVPTFEEIQIFQKAEPRKEYKEDLMERAKKTIEESKKFLKNLEKGDKVRIISGDLKGLIGQVVEVSESGIKVQPALEALSEPYYFMANEIVKIFEVGDHVEILSGKFKGLTGNIIKVEENVAHIISEDNKEEMQVLLNDVKYTTNVVVIQPQSNSDNNRNDYTKHDLVILNDNKTVAVIVSVLRDSVVVYDTEGYTKTVSKIQILNKLNPKGHTKNTYGQEIYPRCIVRVSDGIHKGQLATVKHVYNNFLFLFTEQQKENAGIFVEHINNCYFISANMYDNTRMLARFNNPVLAKANEEQLVSQNYTEDKEKKSFMPRQRTDPKSKRVQLIGQTKTIIKGTWKGYQGSIISLTDKEARIELEAKPKTITVPIDFLNMDASEREGFSSTIATGKTPNYRGANSPFYINTPAYNPE